MPADCFAMGRSTRDSMNVPILHCTSSYFCSNLSAANMGSHFNPRCTERPTRMTLTALDIQFATVEISSHGWARVLPSQLEA